MIYVVRLAGGLSHWNVLVLATKEIYIGCG